MTHPSRNNGAENGRRPLKGPSMRIAMGTLALLAAVVSAGGRPGLSEAEGGLVGDGALGGGGDAPQPNKMTMCLDATVQKQMFEMGAGTMQGMCSKHEFKMSGNRGTGDFICDIGGSRMHSKSTMTMTGDTGYRTEIHTTYDPPFMGQTENDDGPDGAPHRRLQARPASGRHGAAERPDDQHARRHGRYQRRRRPKARPPASGQPPKSDRQPG